MQLWVLGRWKRRYNTKAPQLPPAPFQMLTTFLGHIMCSFIILTYFVLGLKTGRDKREHISSPCWIKWTEAALSPQFWVCATPWRQHHITATPLYMALQNGSLVFELCIKSHTHEWYCRNNIFFANQFCFLRWIQEMKLSFTTFILFNYFCHATSSA